MDAGTVDFGAAVAELVAQIPRGRFARCADVARALGDVRASAAIFRFLREHRELAAAHRVVTERGRPVAAWALRRLREEGWSHDDARAVTTFRGGGLLVRLRDEQVRIAAKVSDRTTFRTVRTIGGVDVAYADGQGFASLVVLRASDLAVVEEVLVQRRVGFPYIPTYLGYREFPLIEAAFRRLAEPPTVLLVDGHGRLHPARCGIACMVGVRLDVPTIGIAKSPLVGEPDRRPRIGEAVPVRIGGAVLGHALRMSASIKPLYVSVGHRVGPRTAVRIVKGLCRTRHPEPLRMADARARNWKEEQRKKTGRKL